MHAKLGDMEFLGEDKKGEGSVHLSCDSGEFRERDRDRRTS